MEFELNKEHIPAHVAVIMDGNGRWAKEKGLPRTAGHVEGVERAKQITEEATRLGVKFLTLYTFSTENWNRPMAEIEALFNLLVTELEDAVFMKNNVRFRVIGDMERLPQSVQKRVTECMNKTAGNTRMTMVVALSYSSRWELTRAARLMAQEVKEGTLEPQDIDEACFSRHLLTDFMPEPDLLIRTGGECRISNYLLWQCAYTEFYFCDTYWPDFREADLRKAIADFQQRQRRYGKTGDQIENNE